MNTFDEAAAAAGHRPAEITSVIGSVWTDPAEAVAEQVGEAWVAAHVYQAHAGDGCSMDPLIVFAKPGLVRTERATITSEDFESMRERWLALYAQGRDAHRVEVLPTDPVELERFLRDEARVAELIAEKGGTARLAQGWTSHWRNRDEAARLAGGSPIIDGSRAIPDGPAITPLADRLREATAFFELPAATSHAEQRRADAEGSSERPASHIDDVMRYAMTADAATEKSEPVAPEADVEQSDEWSLFDEMHASIEAYRIEAQASRERGDRLEAELVATRRTSWRYLRDVACMALGSLVVLVPLALLVGLRLS